MDSSRLLALPPELRIMIYAYLGPPTTARVRVYCGLRQACRLLRNEYDGEVVRLLRLIYQHAKPSYSFTLSSPDLRSLELRVQHDASRPLPDFRSFILIPWCSGLLWKITVIYEPCGQRNIDDFVVISLCQAIGRGIAQAPDLPLTGTAGREKQAMCCM
jgi:hypothetical protein